MGMQIDPRIRQASTPTDEELAKLRADADKLRHDHQARLDLTRPIRRRMLKFSGVTLRDLEAAADCGCSCHFAFDPENHDMGAKCPCQLTEEERNEAAAALFESLGDVLDEEDQYVASVSEGFEQAKARLGATAEVRVMGCPFVLAGEVDGRGFYLRERHGSYRVTISTDESPSADPWEAPASEPTLDIATGDEEDLHGESGKFLYAKALEVAVTAVRSYLRQSTCDHAGVPTRYCPDCGTALVDPSRP